MSQTSIDALVKAPWLPNQLTDLRLWLDGLDVNGDSLPTADNAVVNDWRDKSGNNNHANVQATGSILYNRQHGAINFGPGSNSKLEVANAAGINLNPVARFWAFCFRTNNDLTTLRGVYEQGGGTNCFACYTFTDGNLYIGYANGGAPIYYASFPVLPFQDYIATFNFDEGAGGHRASLNGVVQTQVNAQVLTQHTGDISVGSSGSSFRLHNGSNSSATNCHERHHEILVSAATQTVVDVQRVEGYLAWKYNMVYQLPFGHPYRGAKPL